MTAGRGPRHAARRAVLVVAGVASLAMAPRDAWPQGGGGGGETFYLIVSGAAGERRFADDFHVWSTTLADAAVKRFGARDSLVVILAEDTTRRSPHLRGRSTRENVLAHLARVAARARAGDRVVVVLFGHGNTSDAAPRFNVPGPDLSAEDFRDALAPMREPAVVFVNTASASGDFVKVLSAPNRIIMTATRSGREQNATLFPRYFVEALTGTAGDADKDGRVSLLEAFRYARREVARVFEQGNRIATEHALLDDDGDGAGSEADDASADGRRARAFFLEPLGGTTVASDPRAAALLAERRVLEARIDSLRGRRAAMSEADYQKALEPLMVELAAKTRALRALEERKP